MTVSVRHGDGAGRGLGPGGNRLTVGRYGAGALNIAQGGVVTSGAAVLGEQTGSSGSVTVAGANARWGLGSGSLMVGYGGSGTLIIKAAR